ncbi:MAG: SGNH/GDSL hydrolase family protein [Anaerolineae bacterium]
MKTIVCFGDSNTWGHDPASGARFAYDVRWPGVMRASLGPDFLVIEEGMNGRTTVWDDPVEGHMSGLAYLTPCLKTHRPLDLLVIMLGTNDCKARWGLPASDISRSAGRLVDLALASDCGPAGGPPQVLLIAPPPIARLEGTLFESMFEGAEARSAQLGELYAQEAAIRGCAFLDAGQVIVSSPVDGIHLEAGEHRKLGEAVAEIVRAQLADAS